jgi:long-subunit fatty acid transport protein
MLSKICIFSLAAGFLSNAGFLNAAGISLFEVGARAATMANAYVGLADNPSAIYYNPAGIAFQEGVGLRLNMTYSRVKEKAEVDTEQGLVYRCVRQSKTSCP